MNKFFFIGYMSIGTFLDLFIFINNLHHFHWSLGPESHAESHTLTGSFEVIGYSVNDNRYNGNE